MTFHISRKDQSAFQMKTNLIRWRKNRNYDRSFSLNPISTRYDYSNFNLNFYILFIFVSNFIYNCTISLYSVLDLMLLCVICWVIVLQFDDLCISCLCRRYKIWVIQLNLCFNYVSIKFLFKYNKILCAKYLRVYIAWKRLNWNIMERSKE